MWYSICFGRKISKSSFRQIDYTGKNVFWTARPFSYHLSCHQFNCCCHLSCHLPCCKLYTIFWYVTCLIHIYQPIFHISSLHLYCYCLCHLLFHLTYHLASHHRYSSYQYIYLNIVWHQHMCKVWALPNQCCNYHWNS